MKRVVKLMLLIGMMLLVVGCGKKAGDEGQATPISAEPTTATTQSATAIPATATLEPTEEPPTAMPITAGDAKEVVLAAMRAQLASDGYVNHTVLTTNQTDVTEIKGEIIPPDKVHLTLSQQAGEGMEMEMIVIGEEGWMKSGETDWMATPGMGGMISQFIQNPEQLLEMVSDVTFVGEETLDGEAVVIYSYVQKMGEGESEVGGTAHLWISQESGLPLKLSSESEGMGSITVIEANYEYRSDLSITPPETVATP